MFETIAPFTLVEYANGAMFDPPLVRTVYPRTVVPNRRPYRTSDGYIAALIYNDKHWNAVQPAWVWPEEFGGGGASAWEQTVVREEMWARHESRGPQYMGVTWVGPIVVRHGSTEQQRKHLPPMTRDELTRRAGGAGLTGLYA